MLKEFREFALRGNAVDMAVGIIIGAAFGSIAKSLVSDIIMPPLGLLIGKVDFADLFIILKEGSTPGPYATAAAARGRGRGDKVWRLHKPGGVVSDRLFFGLPACEGHKQIKKKGGRKTGPRRDQAMPVLPVHHSGHGPALPAVHIRA